MLCILIDGIHIYIQVNEFHIDERYIIYRRDVAVHVMEEIYHWSTMYIN